eukprot:jgi/Mesvir1/18865/Mv22758-RA.1
MSAALLLLPLGVALGAGGWYLYKVAEEREAEVGECKEAKWKEQICLGSRWYVGESVTKDKIPAIPKEEAAKVLTKLNGGPFQLAFEFKDEELPKCQEKEVVTALDDGYFSKKWLQAIKPESRSGRFADRFPTRTLKHTVFDGGSWGITVVKEADASTKTFAYAFWTAPSDL